MQGGQDGVGQLLQQRRYRDSDYGCKLYLILNGIYGGYGQPIAVQIARLRFFISLSIEQQPSDDPAPNYGIAPLPNLETRFGAADARRGAAGHSGRLPLQFFR